MFLKLALGVLSLQLVHALNTHDISGLQSDLWTISADKLPREKWTFQLETYETFPLEFEKDKASICFESREEQVLIYHYDREMPILPRGSLSCCLVVNKKNMSYATAPIKVSRIVLSPSKNKTQKTAIHFDIREPQEVFKDFYCTSLIDDYDAISARKTHIPSLADISNLLSIGFRLNPDPI